MNKKVLIDKQALIDKLMKIPGVGSNSDALKTIKRFPSYEPQKAKVPAAIDQYIRKRKSDGDNFHESILATSLLIYEWYMNNAELYEQAWVNGYEVEEEPKFEVIFPNLTGEKDLYLMKFYEKLSITSDRNFYVDQRYIFTEKEIKAIDERYWPFADPSRKCRWDRMDEKLIRSIGTKRPCREKCTPPGKKPKLNKNQQIVFEWLKEEKEERCSFESAIYWYFEDDVEPDIISDRLTQIEFLQVLAAFAEWGMKEVSE